MKKNVYIKKLFISTKKLHKAFPPNLNQNEFDDKFDGRVQSKSLIFNRTKIKLRQFKSFFLY